MEHTSKAPAWFPCPCCGLPTLDERPPGTFLVCPTCGWEDDRIQFERPELALGANRVSLDDAKQNYGELGISDPALRRYQRNAQAIRFRYRLMGSWAVVNLADERRGYKMAPTYLSDALGDLV